MRVTSLPLVGAFTGCVADTASASPPLRRALETKAAKYGRDLPLVIAVLSNTALGTGDDDVGRALFGTPPNTASPTARSRPGLWRDGEACLHDHVVQVIAAQDLYPWSITRQQPQVWTNPGHAPPSPCPPSQGGSGTCRWTKATAQWPMCHRRQFRRRSSSACRPNGRVNARSTVPCRAR